MFIPDGGAIVKSNVLLPPGFRGNELVVSPPAFAPAVTGVMVRNAALAGKRLEEKEE